MNTFKLFLFIFLISVQETLPAQTESVRYAVPVWKNFTNADGTGVYHELLAEIFTPHHIKLEIITAPLHRAITMVKAGEADMVGGIEPSDSEGLVIAKYPLYSDIVSVLFKKVRLKDWKGIDTIRSQAKMSAGPSQIREMLGGNIDLKELNYRDQCIQMLVTDRIHYYVELDFVLKNVFAHFSAKKPGSTFDLEEKVLKLKNLSFNADDYTIRQIKSTLLFMAFTQSEKGRNLEKKFTEGFVRLAKSGVLEKLYKKWDALAVMPSLPSIE